MPERSVDAEACARKMKKENKKISRVSPISEESKSKDASTQICQSDLDNGVIEEIFNKPEHQVLATVNVLIHDNEDPNDYVIKTGDTLLHLAARRNFKSVAEKLLDYGMDAKTENNKGDIALEIAIQEGNDATSALIARRMDPAELRRLFGCNSDRNQSRNQKRLHIQDTLVESKYDFTETLLAVFDSLLVKSKKEGYSHEYDTKPFEEDKNGKLPADQDFNYGDRTLFQILAEKGYKEAMNHPIFQHLIKCKWEKWARYRFVLNFVVYLISLASLTYSVTVAVTVGDLNTYDTRLQRSRLGCEIFTCVVLFLWPTVEFCQMCQMCRYGEPLKKLAVKKLKLNWLEIVAALILVPVMLIRFFCDDRIICYFLALGYFLWVMKLFKYAVVFSETGIYAESLRTIFCRNIIPFSLLFIIVDLAFGGTFLLVLKGDGNLNIHDETSSLLSIWYVGLRTLLESQPVVEYSGTEGYKPIGTVVMLIFIGVTTLVLLNILIAQMTGTYHIIQSDARKSYVVDRARIIARLETDFLSRCLTYCQCRMQNNEQMRYLKSGELKILQNHSTPMEQLNSLLAKVENDLLKTDLKVQTVKTRLKALDAKVNEMHLNK